MSAKVGGAYAALMGKKDKKAQQPKAQDSKPKAAKTISLKDTKETKKPVAKKEEVKKAEAPKKEKAPEKQLTKREYKDERSANDRHYPRAGHAPGAGKKTDEVQDAVDAANQAEIDPAKKEEMEQRRKEREEREAAEKAEAEAEAKRVTYDVYEKQLEEKKAELAKMVKDQKERKVAAPKSGMVTLKKEEEPEMDFSIKKKEGAAKKTAAKGKAAEPVQQAKKKKFVKSEDVQLGFFVKNPNQDRPRGPRPPRQFQERREEKPAAEAEE